MVECSSESNAQWTCEGAPKIIVGSDGNSNRYDESAYRCVINQKVAKTDRPVPFSGAGFLLSKG